MRALLTGMLLPAGLAAAQPPLSAYANLPALDWIALTPDGSKYSALVDSDSKSVFQVIERSSGKPLVAASFAKGSVAGVSWAGPEHVIITRQAAERTGSGVLQRTLEAHHLDLTTLKWSPLLRNSKTLPSIISEPATTRMVGDIPFAFVRTWGYDKNGLQSVVGRINLANGKIDRTESGGKTTADWILDTAGRAVGRGDYDPVTCAWKLSGRPGGSGDWRVLEAGTACSNHPVAGGLGRTDKEITIRKKDAGDWHLYAIDVASGETALSTPNDSDATFYDSFTGLMIGYFKYSLDSMTTYFLNEADQSLWRNVLKAFPGEQVMFLQVSADRNIWLVSIEGRTNGLGYFAIDRIAKTATRLADVYPGIGPDGLAEQRAVRYRSSDGLEIPGYLTLPKDRAAQGLPLIILTPSGRFSGPGFDWMPQALASRGYAVLQPFARGSSGFGPALENAGEGQFTGAVQTDYSDGVRYLAKTGVIDAGRVCIVGSQRNAHVALASAAREPALYRCAVGLMGIYDLRTYLELSKAGGRGREQNVTLWWKAALGITSINDPKLKLSAPKAIAAGLKAPVLLIDSENHPQGDAMEDALRDAGAPPARVKLVGEALWEESNTERLEVLEALIGFLEKHNPPTTAAGAATASQ